MLSKEKRLKRKDFSAFSSISAKNHSSELFSLRSYKGEGKKFSVVVSKKIAKKAVERNLIKRRIYEGIKRNEELFPSGKHIFFAKGLVKKASFSDIEKGIIKIIKN